MVSLSRYSRIPRTFLSPPILTALDGIKDTCAGGGAWEIVEGFDRHMGAENHAENTNWGYAFG